MTEYIYDSEYSTWEFDQGFSSLGVLPAVVIQHCHCKPKPALNRPDETRPTLHPTQVYSGFHLTSFLTVPLLYGEEATEQQPCHILATALPPTELQKAKGTASSLLHTPTGFFAASPHVTNPSPK